MNEKNRVSLSFSVNMEDIMSEIESLFQRVPVMELADLQQEILLNGADFKELDDADELPTLIKRLDKFCKLAEEVTIRGSEICQMVAQYDQSKEQLRNARSNMNPPDMQPLVEAAEEISNIQE